jgi:hypothetical protein
MSWDALVERLPLRGRALGLDPDGPPVLDAHGLSLPVRVRRPGRAPSALSLPLARAEDLADPRGALLVEGMLLALECVVPKASEASLERAHLSPSLLAESLPTLDAPDVAAPTAEDYTVAALAPQRLGRLLPGWSAPVPYVRAPPLEVCVGGQLEVHRLVSWISRHLEVGYVDARADQAQFRSLPEPAAHLWHLSHLEGMVYNGGLAGYLLQAPGHLIRGALAALEAVGAHALLGVVCSAIPLAVRDGADFAARGGPRWWEVHRDGDLPATMEALDGHQPGGSWDLLAHELGPAAAAYAETHRERLVR